MKYSINMNGPKLKLGHIMGNEGVTSRTDKSEVPEFDTGCSCMCHSIIIVLILLGREQGVTLTSLFWSSLILFIFVSSLPSILNLVHQSWWPPTPTLGHLSRVVTPLPLESRWTPPRHWTLRSRSQDLLFPRTIRVRSPGPLVSVIAIPIATAVSFFSSLIHTVSLTSQFLTQCFVLLVCS